MSEERIVPEPKYKSWEDFLEKTTHVERRKWCYTKARFANTGSAFRRPQTYFPERKLTSQDILDILVEAKGRCAYCGSLAVEKMPTKPNGAPLPWEHVGRWIGSLDHIKPRIAGGTNDRENLCWCCLLCNTHGSLRIKGDPNYGGHYPEEESS